jgi:3-hydroxyisobutyrate dehydrogenase-like beta-hydroxyacid dehydrogenase
MGASLGRRLLDPEYKLHAWNRTADRCVVKELVNAGAHFVSSAVEALRVSQTIILCLLDYPTIYKTLAEIEDKSCLKDKMIIDLTNGTPKDARDMELYLTSEWNVAVYYDGGIMATPPLIGTDSAFIFCSGRNNESHVQSVDGRSFQEILSRFGRAEYLGPEVDSSALYDLSLLAGMYGMFGGALTAIALLSKRKNKVLP